MITKRGGNDLFTLILLIGVMALLAVTLTTPPRENAPAYTTTTSTYTETHTTNVNVNVCGVCIDNDR